MAISNSFFKRSLASAVALASFSLVAANANASNLANYSLSSWSGKDTDVGSFGAGYGAELTVDLTNGALVGEASGNASIELFDQTVSLVDLSASVSINDASSDGGSLTAELLGATVYEKSFNDGFVFELKEDVDNYDDTFCATFFDVSASFTIVVVPVTMSAGAEGCANLKFTATPQYNTTTHTGTLNLEVLPSLSAELTASVGVGSSMFSAGVEASVTLLDFTLDTKLYPSYQFNTGTFSYVTTGSIDLDMLGGSVDLYAKVDLGLWSKKYTHNIIDWDGIDKNWVLWSNSKPSAANSKADVATQYATGSYTYSDTGNLAESGSTYTWYRNSVASDTGRTQVQNGTGSSNKKHTLVEADNKQYLQFCVTPKNSYGTTGDQQCSDWTYVGGLALLYFDNSYSTSTAPALAIPYQNYTSGTCINLADYTYSYTLVFPFSTTIPYDNTMSSYKLYSPTDSAATFAFYKSANCSDTASTDYARKLVSANSSNNQTTTSDLGTNWNDVASSVMVVYNETVSAEDVAVSISGNTASSSYVFQVSEGAISETESGSTYKWYRATNPGGSGSTQISGATSSTYSLTPGDDSQFLKVCVTPSNGWSVGTEVCSGWTAVGHLLKLFEHSNYGGSSLVLAWEKSVRETCVNLTDYGFNDKVSSFAWANNNIASSTVSFYKDVNCGGELATRTLSASGNESISSVGTTLGSSWNDAMSSVKVAWNSSITIGAPTLTILANTATEAHTYSDSQSQPESAQYTWYRASNSSGTGAVEIDNFNNRVYTLSPSDDRQYLKVCVLSSNGVVVDEVEACTSWVSVGPLVNLYSDVDQGGTSLSIAYTKQPPGWCYNLTNFGFNDLTSSFTATGPMGGGTLSTYKHVGCNDSGVQSHNLPAGTSLSLNYSGPLNDTRSSFKVNY